MNMADFPFTIFPVLKPFKMHYILYASQHLQMEILLKNMTSLSIFKETALL
jgi:hypothetical protein